LSTQPVHVWGMGEHSNEKIMSNDESQTVKSCDSCSVCCVSLRIDYEGLKKLPDVPCQHIKPGGGCNIYHERPQGCRNWSCGWLKLPDLHEKWRPDKSGFLIRLDGNILIFQATSNVGHSRFWSREFLTEAFDLLSKGYDLGISIPTKKGFTNHLTHLTPRLTQFVESDDFRGAEMAMRGVIFHAKHAKTDKEKPI